MSESFVLVGDVGNTRIKLAIMGCHSSPQEWGQLPVCHHTQIVPQTETVDWKTLQNLMDHLPGSLKACLLSGSGTQRMELLLQEWPAEIPAPRTIRSAVELPVTVSVDYPEKVGVDRVLNAVAVNRVRSAQTPAIIVDAGTAITIDAVSQRGEFLGGAILPGYELESHALHDYTSLLPFIPMEEIIGEFPSAIGRNTRAALRSGLIWGQVGAVKEIVARMTASLEIDAELPPQFFLTGGAAPLLESHLQQPFRSCPQLTLQGLACMAETM